MTKSRGFQSYEVVEWPTEITNVDAKRTAAKAVAACIQPGMRVGVGSGSTSFLTLTEIISRVKLEGFKIYVAPTSIEIQWYCEAAGLSIVQPSDLDLAFDGADEIDPDGNLIKGRGGAMLRERQNFDRAHELIVVADASKHVDRLGTKFTVPVEIRAEKGLSVARNLALLAFQFDLRLASSGKDGPIITESGNVIVDVKIPPNQDPRSFDDCLRSIEGVVETGLFLGYRTQRVVV